MSLHVIVGAGAVGSGTAVRLADAGHDVRIVTRSGSGPVHDRIERIAADAADAARLVELATGARSLYNAANPPYHEWKTAWPPLSTAFIRAAESTGARLITMSNLYGFAKGASPMRAGDELRPPSRKGAIRARMWADALRAHEEGRIRATEARASDYFGPGLGDTAHLGDRVVPKALAGRKVSVVGRPDVPHSWTYIGDVTETLATLGTDDRALGRAWHVPTAAPKTATDMVHMLCAAAGTDPVKAGRVPTSALRLLGLVVPAMRELLEVLYQFDEPFEIDATDTTEVFGLEATPLDDQLRATIAAYRTELTAPA